MSEQLRDTTEWRIFRLFLIDLDDSELDRLRQQLRCEIQSRRECEADFMRLFFTSLHATDLETAEQVIRAERRARREGRRRLTQGIPESVIDFQVMVRMTGGKR